MSAKGKQCRKIKKLSTSTAGADADAMANCVFPEEVMVCILTRLPVKSIIRFKSVCKPWLKLFATPRFVKLHHAQFSDNPENQSVVIYSLSVSLCHTMSLLRIESGERKPVTLDHSYPVFFLDSDFVGLCNGLICMCASPIGHAVVLWNPATKLFKFVRLSKIELGIAIEVSLGFGCDDEGLYFKVVRIFCLIEKGNQIGVEVYSSISDSWRMIDVGFQFNVLSTRNDAIVNGNPYWIAQCDTSEVLVCFDVKKMVFKVVPLPHFGLKLWGGIKVLMVDWKGSLGVIVSNKNGEERVESLDVWILDGESWSKKHTFGLMDLNVHSLLHCSKSGNILGECLNGKLFVFNPATGEFEEIVVDGALKGWFVIDGYVECLAFLKGMEKMVVKNEEEVVRDDDGGVSEGC